MALWSAVLARSLKSKAARTTWFTYRLDLIRYRIMDLFNSFQMARLETFLDTCFLARIADGSFLRASSLALPIAPPRPFMASTTSVVKFAII